MDSRSSILDTATRLFAEQGFAGVSLQTIAARVGITKPSLLYHFHSKDQLREEVLGALFEHWAIRLPGLLRAVTTGEGELDALMVALWDFFDEDPDRARLVARELLDRPERMQERIAESLSPLVSIIAERIKKGQARGILRSEADPEVFVLHMIGLTIAAVAASPATFAPVAGGDPKAARGRARDEIRRVAHCSLFPDSSQGRGDAVSGLVFDPSSGRVDETAAITGNGRLSNTTTDETTTGNGRSSNNG